MMPITNNGLKALTLTNLELFFIGFRSKKAMWF